MKKHILFSVVLLLLALGALTYFTLPSVSEAPSVSQQTFSVTFSVEGLETHTTSVSEGTTALALLREEAEEDGFAFVEKEYAGMGILVEQIGDQKNGTDGKYWMYTINGALAPVGADAYELKPNDVIEWTFAVPENY